MKKKLKLPQGPDSWSKQKVQLCEHQGWFIGNVYISPTAVTVIAETYNKPPCAIDPTLLTRNRQDEVQWVIHEVAGAYWSPRNGVFILPRKSVDWLA